MLRIKLFGGSVLEGQSKALKALISRRHQRALLSILAASPSHAMARERLSALLWPERDTARARNLLNQAIHGLRRVLGEEAIISTGDEVRLDTELVRSDVDDLEGAVESCDWESVVSLYVGPFLDGFSLPNAVDFEHWVDGERARFRDAYLEALEKLALEAAAQDDTHEAVGWWRRLVAEDPYSARLTVGFMLALEAAGDRAAAIRQGLEHAHLLAEELEADPNPEVSGLVERMRRAPATRGAPTAVGPADAVESSRRYPPSPASVVGPARGRARPGVSSWWLVGSMAVLVLLPGAIWIRRARSPRLDPHRVVVGLFQNLTEDSTLDGLGRAIAFGITHGLTTTTLLDVVPTSAVLDATSVDGGPLAGRMLAEATGAGKVIEGRFYAEGDSLRFQVEINDALEDSVLRSLGPLSSPGDSPMGSVELLRRRVAGALAAVLDENLSVPASLTQMPRSPDAYLAFADGWEAFLDSRWSASIQHFRRASELDSSYLVPRLYAVFAHLNRGDWGVADTTARSLDASRQRLGPYDRAVLDLELALIRQDREGSYEAARDAAEIAPGTLPQVQWAWEALSLGHPEEAIGILSSMDPTRGEARRSLAYWRFLTEAHHMMGDHRRELRDARRARDLDPLNPRYYLLEARALAALGRVRDVESVVDEALGRPLSDASLDPGRLLLIVAEELHAHDRPEASIRWFRRAADWYGGLPTEDPERYRPNRVAALLGAGDLGVAEGVLDTLTERRPKSVWGIGLSGTAAAMRGDRDAAEAALSMLSSLDAPDRQPALRSVAQAGILARLGREDDAIHHVRRAFREGLRYGVFPHSGALLDPLSDVPAFQELMRPRGG
jgi:DNA-binding SARP family transcriptional activator/TolB-like protein